MACIVCSTPKQDQSSVPKCLQYLYLGPVVGSILSTASGPVDDSVSLCLQYLYLGPVVDNILSTASEPVHDSVSPACSTCTQDQSSAVSCLQHHDQSTTVSVLPVVPLPKTSRRQYPVRSIRPSRRQCQSCLQYLYLGPVVGSILSAASGPIVGSILSAASPSRTAVSVVRKSGFLAKWAQNTNLPKIPIYVPLM